MRLIIYFLLIIGATSCSAPKLFQRGIKNINKAMIKDPSIKLPSDTVYQFKSDTVRDTVDNVITNTITNTVEKIINDCNYDEERLKSNRQLRHERKLYNDSIDHIEKMYKLQTKRLSDSLTGLKKLRVKDRKILKEKNNTIIKLAKEKTKQERGNWITRVLGRMWWILLIIGFVLGMYGKVLWRMLMSYIPIVK